jgi:hypothetical protein
MERADEKYRPLSLLGATQQLSGSGRDINRTKKWKLLADLVVVQFEIHGCSNRVQPMGNCGHGEKRTCSGV